MKHNTIRYYHNKDIPGSGAACNVNLKYFDSSWFEPMISDYKKYCECRGYDLSFSELGRFVYWLCSCLREKEQIEKREGERVQR